MWCISGTVFDVKSTYQKYRKLPEYKAKLYKHILANS